MTIVDQLKCGECGNDTFVMHSVADKVGRFGGGPFTGNLRSTCTKCSAESIVYVHKPELDVNGSLCGGWA